MISVGGLLTTSTSNEVSRSHSWVSLTFKDHSDVKRTLKTRGAVANLVMVMAVMM